MDDVTLSSPVNNNFFQHTGSAWVNQTYLEFTKLIDGSTVPNDPGGEEARLYLKQVNTANNALAVKLQKASNIVEVELTSPGAICAECGSDDGAKDPTYDFQKGVMRVNLWCGHEYEIDLPEWRRIS